MRGRGKESVRGGERGEGRGERGEGGREAGKDAGYRSLPLM